MFKSLITYITAVPTNLSEHPEVGIGGAMFTFFASPMNVMQFIGATAGVIIAILTLIIKFIELREKMRKIKANKKKREEEK